MNNQIAGVNKLIFFFGGGGGVGERVTASTAFSFIF